MDLDLLPASYCQLTLNEKFTPVTVSLTLQLGEAPPVWVQAIVPSSGAYYS